MPWAIYFDRSGSGVRIVSSCIVLGEARVKAANGKIRAGSGFQLGRDLRHMSSLESRAREFIHRGHAAATTKTDAAAPTTTTEPFCLF